MGRNLMAASRKAARLWYFHEAEARGLKMTKFLNFLRWADKVLIALATLGAVVDVLLLLYQVKEQAKQRQEMRKCVW